MKKTSLFLLTAALTAMSVAAPAAVPVPAAGPAAPQAKPAPAKNSPQYNTRLDSLMVREVPLEYAVWVLSAAWGRHLVVTDAAREKKVRIFLRNIDCLSALKAICHGNGLWYREDPDSGVIYIETLDEYVRNNTLNDKKFVDLVTVVYPRAEDIAESLKDVFKDMVVYTAPEDENGDDSDLIGKALERMDQLSDRSTLVDDNGSKGGGGYSERNNNRNREGMDEVNDYYDDMEEISKKTQQIVPDAKGTPQAKTPGVVFMSVARTANTILLRSSNREMIQQVRDVITALDRPKAQVLLEVKILKLDVTDDKKRQVDFLIHNKSNSAVSGFSEDMVGIPNTDSKGNPLPGFGPIANVIPQAGKDFSRDFVFQVLDDKFELRLKMLDDKGKVRRLATPSLLVADYEASRIFVGDETTILTGVENSVTYVGTENPVPQKVSNPETERRDIGTTLVITPKIHADRTVTIRVMQENASAGELRDIEYAPGQSFKSADVTKQTISSTVVAKSGETLSLGGLLTREKGEGVTSVPVLSKIPVIGPLLFERTVKKEAVRELVVLIRPYVILTPTTAEHMSQQYLVGAISDPEMLGKALDQDREARVRKNMTEMLNSNLEPMETPLF